MNECEKLRNDLKAYVDGQLNPVSRIAVRLHLNQCASCRKEIEEMHQLGKQMRADDALEMTEALRARILAAVPTTAPAAPRLPKWRRRPVLVWGATAAAALTWFALYPTLNTYEPKRKAAVQSAMRTTEMLGYFQDYDEGATANMPLRTMRGTLAGKDTRAPGENAIVHIARNSISDTAGQETTRWAYPRTIDINGNANATKSSPSTKYHVTQARTAVGGKMIAEGQREDRLYKTPSENLVSEGASNLTQKIRPAHLLNQRSAVDNVTFSAPIASPEDSLPTERQVHREASLTVEVANAEQQSEGVERLVKESKGYVAQNQLTTGDDNTRSASLTCKVPVDQFETVMNQIARLGALKAKSLTGEDITEKVSDEQETGHVLRSDIAITEEKLKERRSRVQTLRDEETLRQLRIRVAQSQARLKILNRLGALAEITVELDEKPKAAVAPKPVSPFMEEISGTGQAAAHSFLMALRLPLQLLVCIVVYAPIWAIIVIAYRRFTR